MAMTLGIIRDQRFLEHQTGLTHPESPQRLKAVHEMLDRDFPKGITYIDAELASLETLELVHTPAYIEMVLRTAQLRHIHLAPDTPSGSRSYLAACLAVGSCIRGLKAVVMGRVQACLALVRPPGHHALTDRAGGFCIFNNLGIAARFGLKHLGLERILIVDWDIHHGNAIQDLFYDDPGVFYFSSQYLSSYPHTGDWHETGRNEGLGYNLNLVLPKDVRDQEIVHIYRELLPKVMEHYRPQAVLVAAGFDAHRQDPLGRGGLSSKAFGRLAALLRRLGPESGGPPVMLALEGGYNNGALARSIRETVRAFTEEECPQPQEIVDAGLGRNVVAKALEVHNPLGVWTGRKRKSGRAA